MGASGKKHKNKSHGPRKSSNPKRKPATLNVYSGVCTHSDSPERSTSLCSVDNSMSSIGSSDLSPYCIPDCSYGGHAGDVEMTRCCTCMRWVHYVCCGDSEKDASYEGVYSCSICRTLCDRIINIEKQLVSSHELNQCLLKLVEKSNEECANLRTILSTFIQEGQSSNLPTYKDNAGLINVDTTNVNSALETNKQKILSPVAENLADNPWIPIRPLNSDNPGWTISPIRPSKISTSPELATLPVMSARQTHKKALLTRQKPVNGRTPPAPEGGTPQAPERHTPPAPERRTLPAPEGRAPPAPEGRTLVAPEGCTPPAPDGHTPPAPEGCTPPAPEGRSPPAPEGRTEGRNPPAPVDHTQPVQNEVTQTTSQSSIRKPKLTIIGDSMVRSTGKQISTALPGTVTFVYSISGLTVNNAKHVAPQLVKDHSNSDTVILNLGTNDVKFNDHLDIASDYSSLLDKVKSAAPGCKIAISAVPYRTGKEGPSLNYKIDNLNKALRLLCARDAHIMFINANPDASERNYKRDGLHFNLTGCQSFVQCLVNKIKMNSNFPLALNQSHV